MDTEKRSCFFITPIGSKGSDTYRNTEGLLDSVINPVMTELDYTIEVAHKISETGSINNQIIDRIEKCDLIIANLTELNPNVFYELGLSHAIGKHVIIVAQRNTKLPFDINKERTIFFDNDIAGVFEFITELRTMVNSIDYEQNAKNPFYDAIRVNQIDRKVSETKSEVDNESINDIILEELNSLKNQFKKHMNNFNQRPSKKEAIVLSIYFDSMNDLKEFRVSSDYDSLVGFIDIVYGTEVIIRGNKKTMDIFVDLENQNYRDIESFMHQQMKDLNYPYEIMPQV